LKIINRPASTLVSKPASLVKTAPATTARPTIGFIGLGVMGEPMVTHLHNAGYHVTLHDLKMATARQLAKTLGGHVRAVGSPRLVAERSDIVITMLPNGQVVQDVALGKNGLIGGFKPGALLLDTSSAEPWITQGTAQALAREGVAMVDAPVSGAQWGAQEANLVFMVGAGKAHLRRVRPLLDIMGRAVFHVGALGSGHAMKCLNNLITSVTFSATMEGLAIGKAYGLDPAAMVQVLNASTGQSWITQNHIAQRVLSRSFNDPFKLELMLKDMGIANALARQTATAAPLSGLSQQLWQAASHAAGPGASVSEIARWVEQQAGINVSAGIAPRASASALAKTPSAKKRR
jgi:3-hydroxyisobutyrate dehydrogenase